MSKVILLLVLFAYGFASYAELSAYEGRYRLAMEVEVQEPLLAGLTPYFHWEQVQRDIDSGHLRLDRELKAQIKAEGKPLGQAAPALLAKVLWQCVERAKNYPPLHPSWVGKPHPLEGLKWEMDAEKVEFKFEGSTTRPDEYLRRLRRFAKAIGMDQKLDRPHDASLPEFSLHLHVSRVDGADLSRRVTALNNLLLMRMVDAGVAESLFDGKRTSQFSDDVTTRGVLRWISRDHFEIRRQNGSPETELAELLRWLDIPEDKAVAEIQAATHALVTDKNLDWLLKRSTHASTAVLMNHGPGIKDARYLQTLERTLRENSIYDLHETFKALQRHAFRGHAEASALLRKTAVDFQTRLLSQPLDQWLQTGSPTTLLHLLQMSKAHCPPDLDAIGLTDPRLGPALKKGLNHPGAVFALPEFLSILAHQNASVRDMALAEVASGKVPSNLLIGMLNGLSKVLPKPVGWSAIEKFLTVADSHQLEILRIYMGKFGNLYSAAQWADLAAAERRHASARKSGDGSGVDCPGALGELPKKEEQ